MVRVGGQERRNSPLPYENFICYILPELCPDMGIAQRSINADSSESVPLRSINGDRFLP